MNTDTVHSLTETFEGHAKLRVLVHTCTVYTDTVILATGTGEFYREKHHPERRRRTHRGRA